MRTKFFLCFITGVFWLAGHPLTAQDHYDRLSKIDILHYRFDLTLFDQHDTLQGHAQVRVKCLQDLNQFALDLKNLEPSGKGMRVWEVRENGQKVPFSHRQDQLQLQTAARPGEIRTFAITYSGIPANGLIIAQNKFGARTFFGDNWPNRAFHWLPCVDHPSDKATVEFVVTTPNHYQVVSNGELVEETDLPDQQRRTHWKSGVPLPTKVAVIGVSPFAVQRVGEVDGIAVSTWVYPENRDAGFYDYAIATRALDYFHTHVGPYPFEKLANVQSKTMFGGMENAGAIFYYENSVKGDRSIENTIAHEIAHQWFGNSATEANWHHVWLSEGFATYFTNLYIEHHYGVDAHLRHRLPQRQAVIDYAYQNLAPVVDTTVTDYMKLLNPNSYPKGAWVLHMLRRKVGDEAFWQAIRTYYDRYKYSNALTGDLEAVFEEVSGEQMEPFFQQWIFQAGHPKLKTEWSYNPSTRRVNLEIRQVQSWGVFQFPLEVRLLYPDGSTLDHQVQVTQNQGSFVIVSEQAPEKLVLDPEGWLLFEVSN